MEREWEKKETTNASWLVEKKQRDYGPWQKRQQISFRFFFLSRLCVCVHSAVSLFVCHGRYHYFSIFW